MTCTYKFNTKDGEVKLVGQPAMKAWLAVNGIDSIIAPKGGKYGANPQLVEGEDGQRAAGSAQMSGSYEQVQKGEAETVQAAVEGKHPREIADWIAENAPRADHKIVAKKVADTIRRMESEGAVFNFRVAHMGDIANAELDHSLAVTNFGIDRDRTIVADISVNGADVSDRVGVGYEPILHELVHAVTAVGLELGMTRQFANTELGEAASDLKDIREIVLHTVSERIAAGTATRFEKRLQSRQNNGMASIHEITAWSLTNSDMQKLMEGIKTGRQTVWSKFVEAVRKIIGLPPRNDTALSDVLRIAEQVMNTNLASYAKDLRYDPHLSIVEPTTNKTVGRNLTTEMRDAYNSEVRKGVRYSVKGDDRDERRASGGNKRTVTTEKSAAYDNAIAEGRKRDAMRILHEAVGVEQRDASLDRGGLHAPPGPEDGAPLFDVARGIYPEDIYSSNGLHYYGTGNDKMDAEAYRLINQFEAHPNRTVTIYRAVEKDGAKKIIPGDWVTPIRAYAKEHGEANISGDFKIIKQLVYARDIFTSGDSWLEWGYHPQDFAPELPKGANKNRSLQEAVDGFANRGDIFTNGDSIQEWGYNPEGAEKYSTDNAKTLADVRSAWDAAGIKNFISERNGTINLSQIVVPESGRNSGAGTKAMQQLIDYADATGQRITLSPSADFGGSKSRLTAFYKRFGFVENKGRNKDYAISETMYREPQGQAASSQRYSIDNGKAQAEFGPVHTEFRDDAAGAVKQLMADKNGEAIVHRDDVGDISLVYGDGKMGLSHIVNRRGAGFVDRIPELLRDGTLYSKPGQKDRVFIGTDRDEAVLRFEWDGKAKTWLLSAYEKYPDLKPAGESVQQSRRSQVVDERSTAPLTKDTLRQAVTRGALGSVVNSMIDAGVVVLHDNTSTLPRNVGNNVRGIQAVTMPDGKVHLVASNLSAKNANAVMLHEAFHQGAEKLLGNEQWGELMGRLGSLYRQGEQSSGKAKDFFDKARQRVAAAKAKGGVSAKMELEEFAAYAIEEYESAPASVKKWVDDLLGMIKAWLAKRFGKQFGDVTPAQLSAFAKWAVMDSAVQRRGDIFGDIGNLFSVAGSITDTPAFKRWFGDSKVVDADGKPLVVYHGTPAGRDFSEFRQDKKRVSTTEPGFFFAPDPTVASRYAGWDENFPSVEQGNVMPVYLNIRNPLVVDFKGGKYGRLEAIEQARRDGHDGAYFINHYDAGGVQEQWVAFRPEQIKSAIGNNGDFDPSNPDIRYSVNNGVPNTGEKVTLHYLRNTESAAKNSASFGDVGRGIEPVGEYMNVDQDAPLSAPSDKWESGTITFSNPLVLEHKSTDSNGWKKDLSDMFGGKTGAALSKAVKSAGYDGIITYDKYGLSETVNLSGDKQQGAMPRFSLADDTRTTTAPAEREMQAAVPTDTKVTAAMRAMQAKFQDSKNRLKQVQEAIQGQNNIDDLGLADTYRANENRPGRIAARRDDAIKYLFEPLQKRLADSGFTRDQLEELMHAQHARERNAVIAKINPEHDPNSDEFTGTQGSGMNDDKAVAILRKYSDADELHKIADQARSISRKTLDLLLEYGYINKADHQKLSEQYEFYAPLKGDGEYGPQVKRAMGHGERDEHILENIKRDYELALVAGEANLVKQTMARMAMKYPNPELYTVGVPPMGRRVVKEGGYYVTYKDGMVLGRFKTEQEANRQSELWAAMQQDNYLNYEVSKAKDGEKIQNFVKPLQDNEVIAYFNGTPVRIQFNDELLAQQMGRLSSQQLGPAMEFLKKWMRWLSAAYTGYSPTFIFTNFLRDIQTGTISMLGNQGAMIAAKAWVNYPSATKALYQFATDKKSINKDSEAAKYLYEYRMNGGKTGASHMSDLEAQTKELDRMYDDAYGAVKYAKDGRVGKAAWIASRKGVGKLAHIIEAANQVTENSLRLALFMTLRKEGYTPAKAAQAAKNVTVNFDRKGSATGALSAFYLFFNPAVQGTANAMKALSKGNHKGQAWAALGGMAMLGMWAASKGMDDDKDRWLGAQWDERTKNFRMRAGDHQLNIPVSQEFAPAYAFGVAMGEVMRGESKATAATHMFASFLDAYFPLQGAFKPESDNRLADVAQAFIPTVAKPLDEARTNRNSFGQQVVPENENTKDKPDNLKMYRGTKGTVYDKAAQKIASWGEITGAGKYENDITKVSPETLKSLWRTYTGGLGTFITDSVSLAGLGSAAPDTIDSNDVPIIKRFYRELDVKDIRGRYYDLTKEAKAAITEFEQAKKLGDGDELAKIVEGDKGQLIGLGRMVRATSKAAAALGDEKVEVNANKDLTDAEKRAELKRIEKDEEELYRAGIEAFK